VSIYNRYVINDLNSVNFYSKSIYFAELVEEEKPKSLDQLSIIFKRVSESDKSKLATPSVSNLQNHAIENYNLFSCYEYFSTNFDKLKEAYGLDAVCLMFSISRTQKNKIIKQFFRDAFLHVQLREICYISKSNSNSSVEERVSLTEQEKAAEEALGRSILKATMVSDLQQSNIEDKIGVKKEEFLLIDKITESLFDDLVGDLVNDFDKL
jgi:hypothetical protein